MYVPDPDGQVIKSEKQTFKIEIVARNLETPWGLAFLPDGRLLITERPGRLRIVEERQAPAGGGEGHCRRSGRSRTAACSTSKSIRSTRATAGSTSRTRRRCPATSRRRRRPRPPRSRRPPRRAGADAAVRPIPPSMTVIVRGKINKNNEWTEQQVLFRAQPELYSSTNAHYGSRFIFDKQDHLFYSLGEKQQDGPRAGSVEPARQDPSRQRRRLGADGQSVREARRARCRRSGATVTATRRAWRGIR